MLRTFHYTVPVISCPEDTASSSGQFLNLASFLRDQGYSRHILNYLKSDEEMLQDPPALLLNGKPGKLYDRLHSGDLICVTIRELPDERFCHASEMHQTLDIVYEDEDILVVNKPAGMPVHESGGHHGDTLANAVNTYYARKRAPIVFRCINRLDADTSGLVLIAKHMLSGALLSLQMKQRQIHRTYYALVHGQMAEGGTADFPIARRNGSVIARCVDAEHGDRAVTHYHPLHVDAAMDRTLLEIHLETGRTHQIRVHMTYMGHPLLGDFLYQKREDVLQTFSPSLCVNITPSLTEDSSAYAALPEKVPGISRQALHSGTLSFVHPVTGQPLSFHAPLPDDMVPLLSKNCCIAALKQ